MTRPITAASRSPRGPLRHRLAPATKLPRDLDAQLRRWAHDRGAGEDLPPWLLRLAIVTWQRLHGHIALELEGVHAAMGISSEALYRTEVDTIIAQAIEDDRHRLPT